MRRLLLVLPTLFAFVLLLGLPQAQAQPLQPAAPSAAQAALGSAFTYQGRLSGPNGPVNGPIDVEFRLYDAPTDGKLLGPSLTQMLTVSNGLFTTQLDFGQEIFSGEPRWLEIAVEGDTLTPRQALTAAPYALYAPQAGSATEAGSVPWRGISGMPAGFADGEDNDTAYSAGSGLQLNDTVFTLDTDWTDGRYWRLGGNSGTTAGTHYLGTSDNVALEFKVNNTRAFRLEPNSAGQSNIIAGSSSNTITPGVVGGTIGGGGNSYGPNRVTDYYGTIGGGRNNQAGDNNGSADDGDYATVGGGWGNTASGEYTTVGGGARNTASGYHATVDGGWGNIASGQIATVGGGYYNTAAGDYSFVVGRQAKNTNANHDGVFLFADSTDADFNSVAANEFAVRASGGVRLRTNAILGTGCNLAANSGTWSCTSDRHAKTNFASINPHSVLERLAGIPIQSWSYKGEAEDVRHIGPVAQDFYAAFGVGAGDTTISMVDADGVNMAAIQGLYQLTQEQQAEILALRQENTGQQQEIQALAQAAGREGLALPTWLLALIAGAALAVTGAASICTIVVLHRSRKEAL